jgi:hypothetical protein
MLKILKLPIQPEKACSEGFFRSKIRLSIRGKMNNLGLTLVVAAARQHKKILTQKSTKSTLEK